MGVSHTPSAISPPRFKTVEPAAAGVKAGNRAVRHDIRDFSREFLPRIVHQCIPPRHSPFLFTQEVFRRSLRHDLNDPRAHAASTRAVAWCDPEFRWSCGQRRVLARAKPVLWGRGWRELTQKSPNCRDAQQGKSPLQYKVGNGIFGSACRQMLRLVPDRAMFPYPAEDLFWSLFRRVPA